MPEFADPLVPAATLLAYLDPGTGSLAFQLLLAGLLSGMFYLRTGIAMVKRAFARPSRDG